MEWLKKWIKELEVTNSRFKDKIEEIAKIKPETYNEFREWTPLKLILLNYALNVCTPIIHKIIEKQKYIFNEMHYIDLFAGSGINKIKDSKDDFLVGSPLIATLNHSDYYNSMIFCEKEPSYNEALDLRLKVFEKDNIEVNKKDYQTCLGKILKKVRNKKTYSFFFIDPYSMEFSWDSMKRVLDVRSDVIFTFMTSEIYRAVGLAKAGVGQGEGLTRFFGNDSWKKSYSAEELVKIYESNILKERPDAPIRIIRIKSKQFNFCYHIFFITNKTKGGNNWLRAIDKAKKEIEANSDIAVMQTLDIVKKRQFELSKFLKK